MSNVFATQINPQDKEAIREELDQVFTALGSGSGPGMDISFAILMSRAHVVKACDKAERLPSGGEAIKFVNYFRSGPFRDYLRALRINKRQLHTLGIDGAFGPIVASSYRFRDWLITVKQYEALGAKRHDQVGLVNNLIVLTPMENISIPALEQRIRELDSACATALKKFQD